MGSSLRFARLRPAVLDGLQQCALLATDISARTDEDFHGEGQIGAENAFSANAVAGGLVENAGDGKAAANSSRRRGPFPRPPVGDGGALSEARRAKRKPS